MPEMVFEVRWPDGSARGYYSPSLVVWDYLTEGESYPVPEFVRRAREALGIASDRVQAKYGFPCSRAAASVAAVERDAAPYLAQPHLADPQRADPPQRADLAAPDHAAPGGPDPGPAVLIQRLRR